MRSPFRTCALLRASPRPLRRQACRRGSIGSSAATGGSSFVLTAGLAGAVASALSMATGAFLAERSAAEVVEANVERERQEIAEHPDEDREELS